MAAAITLSRAAAVGRKYFCLSTAVNYSRLITPVRQFSASTQAIRSSCKNECVASDDAVVKDMLSQLESVKEELKTIKKTKEAHELSVKDLFSQLNSIKDELDMIREVNHGVIKDDKKKLQEVAAKQKYMFVRGIYWEISRLQGNIYKFPDWFLFKIENDVPGVPEITVSRVYKNETITIKPKKFTALQTFHFEMPIIVRITTSSLFSSKQIDFHCNAKYDGIVIEKIHHPGDESDKGVLFQELNDKLRERITKFLEARKIDQYTAYWVAQYLQNKIDKREKVDP